MNSMIVQLVAISFTFLLMAGMGVALLIVTMRVSPRATQRDLLIRRPGRRTRSGMYIVAAVHMIAGIALTIRMPGAGASIMVVCVVSACIYMLMAESYALMARTGRLSSADAFHENHGE